ncbi:hypothetical protein RQP46_005769 [Phenoliferia psychrophenolica]
MQVDGEGPDLGATGVVPLVGLGPTTAPDALAFDLGQATFLVLSYCGLLNPQSDAAADTHTHEPAYSTLTWRPLIPTADAITLLAAIPAALVPAGRVPSVVRPAQPSPQSRQQLLDTIARLALEQPLTSEVMRGVRPLNPRLWGGWLEMLRLDHNGEWRAHDSPEAEGERTESKKSRAMVEVLPVFENLFPSLPTLLRHPLLAAPPLPGPTEPHSTLAAPLLTLFALVHALPHLATSTHTATSTSLPWSFPSSVELSMKTHAHRGTRLFTWRILRQWYGLYAGFGEQLREAWVWKGEGSELGSFAPLPPHVEEYKEEHEARFGEWKGESVDADLVQDWASECTGLARLVEELSREERANLWRTPTAPLSADQRAVFETATIGTLTAGELSSTVVNIEGYVLFREGFIPSTSYSSLSTAAARTKPSSSLSTTTTRAGPKPEPFVPTPGTTQLLHSLALHILLRRSVLISFPPSPRRASIITHLRPFPRLEIPPGFPVRDPATADTEAGAFASEEVKNARWGCIDIGAPHLSSTTTSMKRPIETITLSSDPPDHPPPSRRSLRLTPAPPTPRHGAIDPTPDDNARRVRALTLDPYVSDACVDNKATRGASQSSTGSRGATGGSRGETERERIARQTAREAGGGPAAPPTKLRTGSARSRVATISDITAGGSSSASTSAVASSSSSIVHGLALAGSSAPAAAAKGLLDSDRFWDGSTKRVANIYVPDTDSFTFKQVIGPVAQLQRVVLSTYVCDDINWVLSHFPKHIPPMLVKTGSKGGVPEILVADGRTKAFKLAPHAYEMHGYTGSMHTKVVVSQIDNVLYIHDFPIGAPSTSAVGASPADNPTHTRFSKELLRALRRLAIPPKFLAPFRDFDFSKSGQVELVVSNQGA